MKKILSKFRKNTSGLTYLEYALMAALVIVVGVTVVTNIGTKTKTKMEAVEAALE